MLSLNYFGLSHIGKVRSKNEDFWTADPRKGLFVVADGMGGRTGGEVASREAVLKMVSLFDEAGTIFHAEDTQDHLDLLTGILTQVNEWVYVKGAEDDRLTGMGTTLSSISFTLERAFLTHVGDSRIYRFRDCQMEQLTEDHSLARKMYNEGNVDVAAQLSCKHVLTNVVGSRPYVHPDVYQIDYSKSDVFCLCSDGLSNAMDDCEMCAILDSGGSLESRGNQLVNLANRRGGRDNITVLLVEVL